MESKNNKLDQEEYRVGCWDGSISDGEATIQHDSEDVEIKMDVEELYDLDNLVEILQVKDKLVRGNPEGKEDLSKYFNSLVDELEA